MTESRNNAQLHLEALEDRCTPAVVSSTFVAGLDNWTTIRDDNKGAGVKTFGWFSNGGNPGGYVQATDKQDSHHWLWRAPSKYRGDHKDKYGQYLSFDQRQSILTGQFNAPDVVLKGMSAGSTVTLNLNFPKNPGKDFTSYAVQLNEKGGWTVAGGTTAPTEKQVKDVLGSITDLRIRGEYSSGLSKGSLDNVRFGGEGPLISINNVVKFEGDGGTTAFIFNVSLSHILATDATVKFATADGTAKAGQDYTATSGTATIAAGARSENITVNVTADNLSAPTERFTVALTNATNAVIGVNIGTGVIVNDD